MRVAKGELQNKDKICEIDGCENVVCSKNLCNKHYKRKRRAEGKIKSRAKRFNKDLARVVRCRYCVWRNTEMCFRSYPADNLIAGYEIGMTLDDDYCSEGATEID